jgi:catechol-2,3-dioxygenase
MNTLPGRKVTFSHLGVSCFDIEKMKDFYTRVMGMTVSDAGQIGRDGEMEIVFLTTDPDDHHQLVLASGRRPEPVDRSAVVGGSVGAQIFQISFRMQDLATMRTVAKRIEAEQIAPLRGVNHGNAWAIYTRDPEGNTIEIFVDSPWYVAQPCGLPLDFTKTDEEILAETEAYCMAQPEVEPHDAWAAKQAERIVANQRSL